MSNRRKKTIKYHLRNRNIQIKDVMVAKFESTEIYCIPYGKSDEYTLFIPPAFAKMRKRKMIEILANVGFKYERKCVA